MLHLKSEMCKYGSRQSVTSPAGFSLRVCLREQPVCFGKQEVLCFPHRHGCQESHGHSLSGLVVSTHRTADSPVQWSESNIVVREWMGALNAKTQGKATSSTRGAVGASRGHLPAVWLVGSLAGVVLEGVFQKQSHV